MNFAPNLLPAAVGPQLAFLRATIALAFACSILLSWKLWISSRVFPSAPVADFLPTIPFPFDIICACFLVALLLAVALFPRPQKLIFIFLAGAGLLALWDQTRWQPWFYQYFFMLAAIGSYGCDHEGVKRQELALNTCRVVIAFTYIWSGLQKLNANFIRETWPDIAEPLLRAVPGIAKRIPAFLVLMIPVVEILTGAGLISRRFRNTSVLLAITTHIIILVLLVASGENTVVWPWNIAMVLFVWILFWQEETKPVSILRPKAILQGLALILFAMLPAFNLVGLWDSYLSSALYSGNTDQAVILVSPSVIDNLPPAIHQHIWQASKPLFLDMNRWAYGELHVPLYPEPRVYRRVAEQICRYGAESPDIRLLILDKPNMLSGHREREYYDCDHL